MTQNWSSLIFYFILILFSIPFSYPSRSFSLSSHIHNTLSAPSNNYPAKQHFSSTHNECSRNSSIITILVDTTQQSTEATKISSNCITRCEAGRRNEVKIFKEEGKKLQSSDVYTIMQPRRAVTTAADYRRPETYLLLTFKSVNASKLVCGCWCFCVRQMNSKNDDDAINFIFIH